jgi:hypothetical protein
VARDTLGNRKGVWFFDHDTFVLEDLEPWLRRMDRELGRSACCLCHPHSNPDPAITTPAFWLSPARFPAGLPSFEPIPYRETKVSQRPDLFRARSDLRRPDQDTLVRAKEFLAERDLVCDFSLDPRGAGPAFPRHDHLGDLYVFAAEILTEPLYDLESCVEKFTVFYEACPQEWLETEDPVLLWRLMKFQQAMSRRRKGERTNMKQSHSRSPSVGRRQFWLALLQEIAVIRGTFKGGEAYRLSELDSLPDQQLAQIKPIVHPDCQIMIDQGHVWSKFSDIEVPLKLFAIKQENLTVFNMFNGQHALDEIGERLSQEMAWEPARGFAHAKDLFLSLARLLVCMPGNPLDTCVG